MTHSRISRLINAGLKLYIGMVFLFIFSPIVASFIFSFNAERFVSLPMRGFSTVWYQAVAADAFVWEGLRNTLIIGFCTSLVSTLIGFGAAYTDFRYHFLGKNVYLALALLPPTIPPVILGLAMLAFLSRIHLSGASHSVIIAHIVMCVPFAMALVRMRLSQMEQSLEAAAWNLGASEWMAMRHVIIPFCKPAILSALLITMAVSFDEYAVSWFVSGINETLPVKVLGFLQGQVSPRINVIGSFAFVASMLLVILAQTLLMKRKPAPVSFSGQGE